MNMTNYMQLLADNQPWNLILFMAIPVILAETIAVSELLILANSKENKFLINLNKIASIIAGIYMSFVLIYLIPNTLIAFSANNSWRGIIDIIAVSFYLISAIPLIILALRVKKNHLIESEKKIRAIILSAFLITAHIAMIFGMLDPTLINYQNSNQSVQIEHNHH